MEDMFLLLSKSDRKAAKEKFSILNFQHKGLGDLPVIAGCMLEPDAAGQSGTAARG